MANSEGGVGLWQDVWKYGMQEAQDRTLFLTQDISQRLHIVGRN